MIQIMTQRFQFQSYLRDKSIIMKNKDSCSQNKYIAVNEILFCYLMQTEQFNFETLHNCKYFENHATKYNKINVCYAQYGIKAVLTK